MKTMKVFVTLVLIAMALVKPAHAQAAGPQCAALTQEALEEIIATRGSALQKYCPQYVILGVAVRRTVPLTQAMVEEIAATRGTAAGKYSAQYAVEVIPVTSGASHHQPTQAEIDQIIATRGASAGGSWGK